MFSKHSGSICAFGCVVFILTFMFFSSVFGEEINDGYVNDLPPQLSVDSEVQMQQTEPFIIPDNTPLYNGVADDVGYYGFFQREFFPDANAFIGFFHHLHFELNSSVSYDDNIFLTHHCRKSSAVFTLSPYVHYSLGDPATSWNSLTLSYRPQWIWFSNHTNQNTNQHFFNLFCQRDTERNQWDLNIGVAATSGSNIQIGQRTTLITTTGATRFNHVVSDRTSIETTFSSEWLNYIDFLNTFDAKDSTYLNYMLSDKTRLGAGIAVGYAKAEESRNQVYEQLNGSAIWQATSKLNVNLHGGAEFRQTINGRSVTTPVFGADIEFNPFESMSLSLQGYRRIIPAALYTNTDIRITGTAFVYKQRILHRFFITNIIGYEFSDYVPITATPTIHRQDHYIYVTPGVEMRLATWGTLFLSYEHQRNASNYRFFTFVDNQATGGVRLFF